MIDNQKPTKNYVTKLQQSGNYKADLVKAGITYKEINSQSSITEIESSITKHLAWSIVTLTSSQSFSPWDHCQKIEVV